MIPQKKQQGFLSIVAVIIIVVIGLFAIAIVHMFSSTTYSSAKDLAAKKAFYLAEAGLEKGNANLIANIDPTQPNIYCDNNWKTTTTLGDGQFHFKCVYYNSTPANLTVNISNTTRIIPVSTLSGYAPLGVLQIDSEFIDYTGASSQSSVCTTAPCLVAKTRGTQSSTAATHNIGANVAQNEVVITAEGGSPNLTDPNGKRTLAKAIYIAPPSPLQYAWAVGEDGHILQRDSTGTWTNFASPTTNNLYGTTCADGNNCWAVGANGVIIKWNGTSWSNVSSPTNTTLKAADCTATNNCWAVGANGVIIKWNGSSWSNIASSTSNDLNAVSCANTNNCWAVGNSGTIVRWNGASWSNTSYATTAMLDGVSCPSATLCWAVGTNGTILKWNGSVWSIFTPSPTSQNMLAISCWNINNCWASTPSNRFERYLNGSWSEQLTALPNNNDYNGVYCANPTLCITVGQQNSHKVVIGEWNSSQWQWKKAGIINDPGGDLYAVTGDAGTSVSFIDIGWTDIVN